MTTNNDDPKHHDHHHGHESDRGLKGIIRYVKMAPEMWRSPMNDAIVDLIAPTKGETVIDIGAGMGPGTVKAAKAGATVIAVEPTPFLRTVLQMRRMSQRARKNIRILDAGAEKLPAADASVDAVFAVNTMHHWIDPAAGAAEIGRVLKPGGRVALVDEDFQNPAHPDFDRFAHQGAMEHHGFSMVDATEMGELLTAAGVSNVDAGERTIAGAPAIVVVST